MKQLLQILTCKDLHDDVFCVGEESDEEDRPKNAWGRR